MRLNSVEKHSLDREKKRDKWWWNKGKGRLPTSRHESRIPLLKPIRHALAKSGRHLNLQAPLCPQFHSFIPQTQRIDNPYHPGDSKATSPGDLSNPNKDLPIMWWPRRRIPASSNVAKEISRLNSMNLVMLLFFLISCRDTFTGLSIDKVHFSSTNHSGAEKLEIGTCQSVLAFS